MALAVELVAQGIAFGIRCLVPGWADSEASPAWGRLVGALVGAVVAVGGTRHFVEGLRFEWPSHRRGSPRAILDVLRQAISKVAIRQLCGGFLIVLAVMTLSVGAISLGGGWTFGDRAWSWGILYGLGAGLGAAVIEEVFFRRTLLRVALSRCRRVVALGISAAAFGLLHGVPRLLGGMAWGDAAWLTIAITLGPGMVLGAAWLATQRLWLPIGIHVAWNIGEYSILGINVPGDAGGRGVFASTWSGTTWLTGGQLGLDASLVTLIALLIVAAFLMCWARHNRRLERAS
ncbi:CPBP family intramembrane glutamic endopeptidase [Acidipropionibacterium virtanenii]|uniref:CPBP family intramembrane glutamic endopeptidase n=1 Tax=Acidipropionibacterium virtanenii TaxID=2057246 RepID=UPI0015F09A9E|nr:CPBP family intramembrane glutamic endopeptidase [Acidipropionibacterium virtanenii]